MAMAVLSHGSMGSHHHPMHSGVDLTPAMTPQSSLRDGTKKMTPRKTVRAKIMGSSLRVDQLKYMPEANDAVENGWQTKLEDVHSRVSGLFNCYTMSDVLFQVGTHTIPAHKFLLASASPVWYKQLYEDDPGERIDFTTRSPLVSESGLESWYNSAMGNVGNRHVVLEITDVPHLAFFEFLQFIYTDHVSISLDNVLPLLLLADTYKVAGLSDKCMDFLRHEVMPSSVLRVIQILKKLMLKACTSLWKAIVAQSKSVRKFREMTLAERRAKMEENGSSLGSRMSSRRVSALSGRSGRSRSSRTGSVRSSGNFYRESDAESLMGEGEWGDTASVLDVAQSFTRKAFRVIQSQGLEARLIFFVEEINRRCWKCIQEETAAVLSCADMWEQDVKMVREILSLEALSVPEIVLFRAVIDWAQRKCVKNGFKPTAENLKQFLGMETLLLLRFPAMTQEQFQWEVVPPGLLEYEDVEQLLGSISKKHAILGRFNGKPRTNINFHREHSGSLRPGSSSVNLGAVAAQNASYDEATRTLYNAAPDDPVDSILASKLLRGYLKTKVLCDYGDTMTTVSEAELAQQAAGSRLPPIAPTASSSPPQSRSSRVSVTGAGPETWHTGPRPSVIAINQAALAHRLEEEARGGSTFAHPEDFYRICTGLYAFRGDSLLELWLEDGEVVCRDHGPNERLEDPDLDESDPQAARQILGLPEGPPLGRGIPLDSFLCQ